VGLPLDEELEVRQINILHPQGSKRRHQHISFAPETTLENLHVTVVAPRRMARGMTSCCGKIKHIFFSVSHEGGRSTLNHGVVKLARKRGLPYRGMGSPRCARPRGALKAWGISWLREEEGGVNLRRR
jgi:hypothetical protein